MIATPVLAILVVAAHLGREVVGGGTPLAGIEEVATIEGNGELAIEELTLQAGIERPAALATALRNLARGIVVATTLERNLAGQDGLNLHTGVPREVFASIDVNAVFLSIERGGEVAAVELMIVAVERCGDIDLVPKLVLGDNLYTAVAFLGNVDRGAVTDVVLHIAETLRHIAGGTIVGADAERMLFPSAQIVDLERVGIGRRQVGITVGDGRRVGNVLEGS